MMSFKEEKNGIKITYYDISIFDLLYYTIEYKNYIFELRLLPLHLLKFFITLKMHSDLVRGLASVQHYLTLRFTPATWHKDSEYSTKKNFYFRQQIIILPHAICSTMHILISYQILIQANYHLQIM